MLNNRKKPSRIFWTTSNCLIDGTMTANFETINKTAVTMTAQRNYRKMNYNQKYKANRIRPVSPKGGFVLYCSKQGKSIYLLPPTQTVGDALG